MTISKYTNIIDSVMSLGMKRINSNPDMDIDELFRSATEGEERTVLIVIYDDPVEGEKLKDVVTDSSRKLWSQGLAHGQDEQGRGQIVKIDKPPYTVTYKIAVSAWYRLIAQQSTFRELFWSDQYVAEGENFARDLEVWDRFWKKYNNLVSLNIIEKKILKQNNEVYA